MHTKYWWGNLLENVHLEGWGDGKITIRYKIDLQETGYEVAGTGCQIVNFGTRGVETFRTSGLVSKYRE
jgi:hypothetical protein